MSTDVMDGHDGLTRRSVLKASATTAGLGLVGTAAADDDTSSTRPIPCLDMTGVLERDDVTTVDASSVAPETSSGIGPGSFLLISRGGTTAGCTANFIWDGADGGTYLGAAGHCFLPDGAAASESAGGSFDTSGVTVRACIDCAFGGATGLNGLQGGELVELGEVVYARQSQDGNAVAFGETFLTKGRSGAGLGHGGDSWSAATTSAPGDSGAAVQSCTPTLTGLQGVEAAGVLTHLTTNGGVAGTTMSRAKEMAGEVGLDISARLV